MSDQAPRPLTRTRRTLEQRLALAELAESRAAGRLAKKTEKVRQYLAVQNSRERKLDTRRKIIAGALALEHRERSTHWDKVFGALLDEYVIRKDERALFGLQPHLPEVEAKLLADLKAVQQERAAKRGKTRG